MPKRKRKTIQKGRESTFKEKGKTMNNDYIYNELDFKTMFGLFELSRNLNLLKKEVDIAQIVFDCL